MRTGAVRVLEAGFWDGAFAPAVESDRVYFATGDGRLTSVAKSRCREAPSVDGYSLV